VKEKHINASISLNNFDDALPGPQAFSHDDDGDWGEKKQGVRAIIACRSPTGPIKNARRWDSGFRIPVSGLETMQKRKQKK
jgi:hypothetical protein